MLIRPWMLVAVWVCTLGVYASAGAQTHLFAYRGEPLPITAWLVCGPFPAGEPGALGDSVHLSYFDTDFLAAWGGERLVSPDADEIFAFNGMRIPWNHVEADGIYVNLDDAVSRADEVLAYGYCELFAALDTPVVLSFGSNDGARVWLNGEQVWDIPFARGYTEGEDRIPMVLRAGRNRLLVKIEERGHTWGFGAKILPLDADALEHRLPLFDLTPGDNGAPLLVYRLAPSLIGSVVRDVALSIHEDVAGHPVVWQGNWNRTPAMVLPVTADDYGEYVVRVSARLVNDTEVESELPFVAGHRADYPLFADGATAYRIVVGTHASESERWAAAELQHWLKEAGGAHFPIVEDTVPVRPQSIVVGYNAHTATLLGEDVARPRDDDESFEYRSAGPTILIWGGAERGTMYGVHTFLERELGVQWYTRDVTVVPSRDSWRFTNLRHREQPGIRVRNDFYFEAFDPIWAARNKMNGVMSLREQPGGVEGYWSVHTFFPFMPPEEFFESHPEYYSLIDGERRWERAQLCLTNPDVLDIITERLRERMRQSPDYLIYSVSQNDWRDPCQCEECQAIARNEGSEAGPVLWFVNQVAERIEDEFPDKFVGTLAYQYTRKPTATLRPRHNVVIRLCSIECCFAHDFTSCPENAEFMDDMRGWAAIAPHLYVWDYVVNFSHYVMPYPNFYVLQPNIQSFRDHNAIGIMEQAAYQSRGGEFAELRAYVIAKLLWDPECDVEPLIDDFMYGYYGRSGQYIRAYFNLLHNQITPETHIGLGLRPDDKIFSDAFVREAGWLFDKAEAVAENTEMLHRVELARLPLLYLKCKRTPLRAVQDGTYARLRVITEREEVTHFAEMGAPHREAFFAEMDAAALQR